MSTVDDLIRKLCPSGVKFKTIGEVGGYSDTRVDATDLDETSFVGVDNLVSNRGGKVDADHRPNTERLTAYRAGDILIGNIRPYLRKIWLATNDGGCSGDVLAIRIRPGYSEALIPEFLYYLLSPDGFFSYNMQHAKGAKMPRGDKAAILRYRVPMPPVEVQREIACSLDTFAALAADLEAELEAELKARKTQYAFYRERLLKFGKSWDVPWMTIGEICDVSRGRVISKDYLRDHPGNYPVYSSQTLNNGVFGYIDSYACDEESITWTTDGANAGSVFYHVGKKFSLTNVCGLLKVTRPDVITRYVYYQLQYRAQEFVSSGMGNPKLMAKPMSLISIPVPSLTEQEQIVRILDKFDELFNGLSLGLPAELNARRRQYEYYRGKLLTFEEAVA